jgi:hypothetical protein
LQKDAVELVSEKKRYSSTAVRWDTIRSMGESGGLHEVELVGFQLKANVVNGAGKVLQTLPKQPLHFVYALKWIGSGWRLETGKAAA